MSTQLNCQFIRLLCQRLHTVVVDRFPRRGGGGEGSGALNIFSSNGGWGHEKDFNIRGWVEKIF